MHLKRFHIPVFLLFLFMLQFSFYATGQSTDSLKKDTSETINIRTSGKIQKYLNDDYFLYNTEPAQSAKNLWQRIVFWIQQLIFEFFYLLGKGGNLISFIFYAVVLAVLLFIILKLLGVSPHSFFLKTKKIKLSDIPVFEEDISTVDFDKVINLAIKNQDYRKAVRFLYIKTLKLLSEIEEIEWKKEKTNKDYNREMKNSRFFFEFSKLTRFYEYVWYGDFNIKQTFFNTVYGDFNRFFKNFE